MGEVTGFDHGSVVGIYVAAPHAKANRIFGINVSAAALAMGDRCLALVRQDCEVDLHRAGIDWRKRALLGSGVLGTRTKLNRAIAVVAVLHGKTADAGAVVATLVLMPCRIAIM